MSERESNAIADINESIFMYVLDGTKRQNLPPHNVLMFSFHFTFNSFSHGREKEREKI